MPAQQQMLPELEQPQRTGRPAAHSGPKPAPVWLQRMSLAVFVLFCFYIGGLLTLLPWWPKFWEQNGWLQSHPAVLDLAQRGWVKGLVSGFGLLDIWVGISELMHYRDFRGPAHDSRV